jgi:DNA-binding transcriptional MocR family regulator
MPQLQIVQRVNRSMQCSACGAASTAACDCGAPYVPATARAAKAIAATPRKSDRAIAREIGVSDTTVLRARRATASHEAVEPRIGRDGKVRRLPKKPAEMEIPSQEEADRSFQSQLYEMACSMVDKRMSGTTRERFFAHLRRKYNGTLSQSPDQKAAKGLPA